MHDVASSPRSIRALGSICLASVLALGTVVFGGPTTIVGAEQSDLVVESDQLTGSASAFRPINPIRILDTREDDRYGRLWIESAISIDPVSDTGVADAAGVDPADITAVVVNVTMINAAGELAPFAESPSDLIGFGTVWPTGSTRLLTSTNNTQFAGHTIPNLVIAPLGLERKISFFSSTTAHLALDVLGVFVASGPTTAGRFEALGPVRALDTRDAGVADFAPNKTRVIDLTDAGVPADATGVVMNVTAIKSRGGGFYRVWSAGEPEPEHSSVNVLGVDYQAGNQVISAVENGKIKVFTNVGGGLTIDVTGYFTGDSGDPTSEGLYVPFSPGRLLDTRERSGATGLTSGEPLRGDRALKLQIDGRLDIPDGDAKAVALNLTAIRANERGFVKAFPSGGKEPNTSALNFTTGGQTVPNHGITSIDPTSGKIDLLASTGTHLAVDATGYFLAAGAAAPAGSSPATRLVEPGTFAPDPLAPGAPATGPFDFLFDRGSYSRSGVRPNPTIRVAWPNCVSIRYALNVDLAKNDEQVQVLVESVEEMELYTGIDFQFAGVTSSGMNIDSPILLPENFDRQLGRRQGGELAAEFKYLPPDSNGADSVSLVIGFSNNNDTVDIRDSGVIGVGGSLSEEPDRNGRSEALRGFAVIDLPELYLDGPKGTQTLQRIKATTTHELGHLMGLGHVSDFDPRDGSLSKLFQGLDSKAGTWSDAVVQDQLMYPSLNVGAGTSFDIGDQRGLWELYAAPFCPPAKDSLLDERTSTNGVDDTDWSTVEIVKSDDDFG